MHTTTASTVITSQHKMHFATQWLKAWPIDKAVLFDPLTNWQVCTVQLTDSKAVWLDQVTGLCGSTDWQGCTA